MIPTLLRCALALAAALLAPVAASALDVFATSYFSPAAGDPDPTQSGVLKINLTTGAVTTFIAESPTGVLQPTDLAVDTASNTLYVATQGGTIWRYNAFTGAPLPSLVPGAAAGTFAKLPNAGFGDGYNSIVLRSNGTLVAATAFGALTPYNLVSGAASADLASGLSFPSGIAESLAGGTLFVATGDPFGGPGALLSVPGSGGAPTTILAAGAVGGIRGAAKPTLLPPRGDYNRNGSTSGEDFIAWRLAFGASGSTADGNGNGVVDAGDYTVWRDTLGEQQTLVVADLHNNRLAKLNVNGTGVGTLAVIPPDIPTPLPPTANPELPSNSPSEILVTPQGTLLVSTLGLTRRPDNRGALLEFSRQGTLLRTIAAGLPPLSSIAFAPATGTSVAVPEPAALLLLALALSGVSFRGARR